MYMEYTMSNKTQIHILIDKQIKSDFEKKCLENDLTVSQVLRQFIKEYLKGEKND